MQYSDLTQEQAEIYDQLKKWIRHSNIQGISKMSVDDRNFYLGVQDNAGWTLLHDAARSGSPETITALLEDLNPDQKVQLLRIKDRDKQTPLHVAALSGSPKVITAMLEGLDMTQCRALILGDNTNGIEGVVSKLVAEGLTDKISTLIGGIKKVSSLTQEDRYALIGGIAAHCPPDTKITVDAGILRQAFGAVHNAPGEKDPAATATAAVVSPPAAAEQNNGATPPGCGGRKHPVKRGFDGNPVSRWNYPGLDR